MPIFFLKFLSTGSGDASTPYPATQRSRPQSTPSGGTRPSSSEAAIAVYGAQAMRQRPVSAKTGHRDTGRFKIVHVKQICNLPLCFKLRFETSVCL